MKMNKIASILSVGAVALAFASCHNDEQIFPDYEGGTTAYFAYQYPIRTLILGNVETYDNTSDNEHRFTIYGTCGGSYEGINAKINVKIDESLTEGLTFEDGTPVKPLPKDYYNYDEVNGSVLDYDGGFRGGVEVKLNDKFFADTASLKNTYVIPLLMGDYSGVDKVAVGTPKPGVSSPKKQNANDWETTPKDFVLFCVNYENQYNSTYIRRGVDKFDKLQTVQTEIGEETTIVIHAGAKTENVWDSQFWINVDQLFAANDEFELSMDVKATKTSSISSQIHKNPSEYLTGGSIGSVTFPMDWAHFEKKGTFSSSEAGGHSIAFNLNDQADANDYYIDNVSFKINGVELITNVTCDSVDNENFWTKVDKGQVLKSQYGKSKIYRTDTTGHKKVTNERYIGKFVEDGEIVYTASKSLNSIQIPVRVDVDGNILTCNLDCTFDNNGECTVTTKTEGCVASGTGKYVTNGAPKAWGNKDRDVLFLDYTLDFGNNHFGNEQVMYETKDTLVWRDRGSAASIQTYTPSYKE